MEQTRTAQSQVKVPAKRGVQDKGFRELFGTGEIIQYTIAIVVYLLLGLLFRDKVLNIGVGPLFFVVWIWLVPPLWDRLRRRWSAR